LALAKPKADREAALRTCPPSLPSSPTLANSAVLARTFSDFCSDPPSSGTGADRTPTTPPCRFFQLRLSEPLAFQGDAPPTGYTHRRRFRFSRFPPCSAVDDLLMARRQTGTGKTAGFHPAECWSGSSRAIAPDCPQQPVARVLVPWCRLPTARELCGKGAADTRAGWSTVPIRRILSQ